MPEGHTLHRLARDHHRWFAGRPVALSSPQGRFSEGAELLDAERLDAATAVGKHLLYRFADQWIHVHLGLFGKFRRHANPAPPPRPTVRLRIVGDERTVDLTGPTACEVLDPPARDALLDRLGPDPLDPDADPERFVASLARRRKPIAAALLDQRAVAGVGNVYRAELLLRAGIDPHRPANTLGRPEAMALWNDMVELFPIGVRYNRILCRTPDEVGRPYSRMRRRDGLSVYKKQACARCDGPVVAEPIGGRTLYWCPCCQG